MSCTRHDSFVMSKVHDKKTHWVDTRGSLCLCHLVVIYKCHKMNIDFSVSFNASLPIVLTECFPVTSSGVLTVKFKVSLNSFGVFFTKCSYLPYTTWLQYYYAPAPLGGGIKRWCCLTSDCLTSVCLSVAYIGPKSRTERPRLTQRSHVTRNSDTTFRVKRLKVN